MKEEIVAMANQGRKRGFGATGGPIEPREPPINDDQHMADEDERDPENTRDMLWLYLQGNLRAQKEGNERLTGAIEHQTTAMDAIRQAQEDQDQRHTDAVLVAADKAANAQIEAAEKAASARKFEAKMAAILAAFLIVGVLILAGASVSGKYAGGEVTAGHGASP